MLVLLVQLQLSCKMNGRITQCCEPVTSLIILHS